MRHLINHISILRTKVSLSALPQRRERQQGALHAHNAIGEEG